MGEVVVNSQSQSLLVDVEGLAVLMDVCPRTVMRMNNSGKLPRHLKVNRCVRWNIEEIRLWIAYGMPVRTKWEVIWATLRDAPRN